MMTLNAEKRDMSVKAKKLRREGYVPGSLCGKDLKEPVALKISEFEAERFMSKRHEGQQNGTAGWRSEVQRNRKGCGLQSIVEADHVY